ncbi:MAG: MoxR family ATPase [Candidatus Eisenbacteria bacterium]|nr:MoxR family ATPase [Candidatus Eisenbacteria bacterium]
MTSANAPLEALERLKSGHDRIVREVRKVIVGQDRVVEELLTALFANGHCLLVGVPGLAKTLLVSSLARVLDLKFSRIQFTPDLMPSDITGTEVLEENRSTGQREFRFLRGPLFANLVLADEINRTPPKTQAALLQAMQEREVSAGGQTMRLEPPFFVLATQNPIELEGTYPLPEAQLDRFMFQVQVDYPSQAEEERIVTETTGASVPDLQPVFASKELTDFQALVRRVPASEFVVRYAVRLARATRPTEEGSPDFVKQWVSWGAGPRASQYLVLGAKTRAALDGRFAPSIEDIRAVAPSVLRHRVIPNFNAEADGVRSPEIIRQLLEKVSADGKGA